MVHEVWYDLLALYSEIYGFISREGLLLYFETRQSGIIQADRDRGLAQQ